MSGIEITITLPSGITCGELTTVSGALVKASTEFVDWERLYAKDSDAIGVEGVVLLDIADQITRHERGERSKAKEESK